MSEIYRISFGSVWRDSIHVTIFIYFIFLHSTQGPGTSEWWWKRMHYALRIKKNQQRTKTATEILKKHIFAFVRMLPRITVFFLLIFLCKIILWLIYFMSHCHRLKCFLFQLFSLVLCRCIFFSFSFFWISFILLLKCTKQKRNKTNHWIE